MVSVGCVLFNCRDRGIQPGGGYDFDPLVAALSDSRDRPNLIFFCSTDRQRPAMASDRPVPCAVHVNDGLGARVRPQPSAATHCRTRAEREAK